MATHAKFLGSLVLFGASAVSVLGCSGGSSGGGGAASTAAPVASSPSGASATATAEITSLSLSAQAGGLLQGDVPVAFRLAHPASAAGDAVVRYSVDGGQTWSDATPTAASASTQGLTTAPAPGLEHTFVWDSVADIPGFESDVRISVEAVGGTSLVAGPVGVDNQSVSNHVTITRQPYLQSTTAASTVISWRTGTSVEGIVEYGPTPALGQSAQTGVRELRHDVLLTGLRPGTRYYYRIVEGGKPLTARQTFLSAPDAQDGEFSFVVVGDSGMNNPEQIAIANLLAQETEAEFFLHTGDVIYPVGGLGAAVAEYDARYFRPYQDLLRRVPGWPVVGNHDLYGLYGKPFKQAFTLPDNGAGKIFNELYYAFEWGDAKFIAIDTNTVFRLGSGPHMTWLRNELNTTKKWVVVYMHAPLYSAGKHGDSSTLQSNLESIFENNGVDLVLAGHDHNYERSKPIKQFNQSPGYAGLVHIVTGGGGAGLRPVNPTPRTEVAISAHHYLKVTFQGDNLHGVATDINGQTIDTFTIRDQ